jgi:hypothetical protein
MNTTGSTTGENWGESAPKWIRLDSIWRRVQGLFLRPPIASTAVKYGGIEPKLNRFESPEGIFVGDAVFMLINFLLHARDQWVRPVPDGRGV